MPWAGEHPKEKAKKTKSSTVCVSLSTSTRASFCLCLSNDIIASFSSGFEGEGGWQYHLHRRTLLDTAAYLYADKVAVYGSPQSVSLAGWFCGVG